MSYLLFIFLDQILKNIFYRRSEAVVNSGIAFGIFSNSGNFLAILAGIFFFILCLFIFQRFPQYRLSVSIILSGAVSNFLDRIFYGGVIDYLYLPFFPSFNLADLAICLGTVIFFYKRCKKKA